MRIAVASCFVVVAGVTAVNPASAEDPPRGVGFAFAVGVTHSSTRSTVEADYGGRTAMAFGGRVALQLTRGFALTWGVQVAQFGFSGGPEGLVLAPDALSNDACSDGVGEACEGDVDTALNMMSLQIVPRYQFRNAVFVAAGIEVNFLIGARSRSASMDTVVDSTRHFRYRAPYVSQRLVLGYRFVSLLSVELALHQPLMTWGNDNVGLGRKFADGTAGILSLVLGRR